MRFSLKIDFFIFQLLAIGNQVGKIYLYDLDVDHPSATK